MSDPTGDNGARWTVDEDGTLRFGDRRRMAHNLVRSSLAPNDPNTGNNHLTSDAHAALVRAVRDAAHVPALQATARTLTAARDRLLDQIAHLPADLTKFGKGRLDAYQEALDLLTEAPDGAH